MSYKTANLYASRVYEEHPLALWSFDEDITFTSLLTEAKKSITTANWTLSANTTSASVSIPGNPIDNSPMRVLYVSGSAAPTMSFQLTSPINDSVQNVLDDQKGSVCFNVFAYINEQTINYIDNIKIGFYINGSTYVYTQYNTNFFIQNLWTKIEHTQSLSGVTTFAPYVQVTYNTSILNQSNSSISFAGVSCGQWSEPYNSINSGITSYTIPTSFATAAGQASLKGIEIDAYGFSNASTAYVVEYNNRLLAVSSGIPMTYGSKSNMSILSTGDIDNFDDSLDGGDVTSAQLSDISGGTPSSTYSLFIDGGTPFNIPDLFAIPSIIFKGNGFLNSTGNYSSITAEFWLRINPMTVHETRIMGPLQSDDGIYVDNNYIILKVGQYKRSYYVGQWYRPMLIHFIQSPSELSLMINGEKVIKIDIDNLEQFNFNTSTNPYIAFFGDNLIPQFEINSFSIFPYKVAEEIAKRRFVYGQGVDELENISYASSSDLTYIDFPFAKYASTISYPKRLWTDAYFNNITVSSEGIEPINYNVPDILFTNNSSSLTQSQAQAIWSNFEKDNFGLQFEYSTNNFIEMLPTSSYDNFDSTIYLPNINVTNTLPQTIHAVFETASGSAGYMTDQSLLYFKDLSTTDYIDIRISSGSIQYVFNDSILESYSVSDQELVCVGIKFDDFIVEYPQTSNILSNPETTSLNFAGSGNRTFLGKVYLLNINDEFSSDIMSGSIFNATGTAEKTGFSGMLDYVGTYKLYPVQSNNSVYLDIASYGYWESSYPLSYFAKYINTSAGSMAYDLDMIQFNIDTPTPIYSIPDALSDLYFDNLAVKTFITLQTSASVGQLPYTDFSNTVQIRSNRLVDFDELTSFNNTKFEICNRTLICPPKESVEDFNDYHITLHLEVISKGIKTNSLKVKRMSLASVAYDETSNYKINTPTGRTIDVFAKSGSVSLYKQDVPFSMSIESSPYLYVSGISGIETAYSASATASVGVSFNINENEKAGYEVVGLQMQIMYTKESAFSGSVQFASLSTESNSKRYSFYFIPETDGQRAFIKIFNESNVEVTNIDYYVDGSSVNKVAIEPLKWTTIVMSFPESILSVPGHFDVYPGVAIDNFAVFDLSRSKDVQIQVSNSWDDIRTTYPLWSNVSASGNTWATIYNVESIATGNYVDGKKVFQSYYGISSIIGNDNGNLNVNFDRINLVNDINWSSFEVITT